MADPRCEECRGAGVTVETKDGYSFARICDCHVGETRRRIAARCGLRLGQLESRFKRYDIKTHENRAEALDVARSFVEYVRDSARPALRRDYFLYLSGPNGRGKSYLAEAVVNELAELGVNYSEPHLLGYFITEADLYSELQARIRDRDRGSPEALVDELLGYGFLAIDDVGVQPFGDWFQGMMYRLLDRRVQDAAPVILTSNYDLAEGDDGWLPRCFPAHKRHLLDRLDPVTVELELGGPSWRREGDQEELYEGEK